MGYLTKGDEMATKFIGLDSSGNQVRDGATFAGDSYNEKELLKSFKKDSRVVKIIKDGKQIWKR